MNTETMTNLEQAATGINAEEMKQIAASLPVKSDLRAGAKPRCTLPCNRPY